MANQLLKLNPLQKHKTFYSFKINPLEDTQEDIIDLIVNKNEEEIPKSLNGL